MTIEDILNKLGLTTLREATDNEAFLLEEIAKLQKQLRDQYKGNAKDDADSASAVAHLGYAIKYVNEGNPNLAESQIKAAIELLS